MVGFTAGPSGARSTLLLLEAICSLIHTASIIYVLTEFLLARETLDKTYPKQSLKDACFDNTFVRFQKSSVLTQFEGGNTAYVVLQESFH